MSVTTIYRCCGTISTSLVGLVMLSKSSSFDNLPKENVTQMNSERTKFTTKFCRASSLILLFFLTFIFFLYVYMGAELHLEVKSTVAGTTQFFFPSKNDTLSEERSYVSKMPLGWSKLTSPLPLTTQWIRWDPLNGAGEFIIKSLYIKIPLIEVPISLGSVTANNQISELAVHIDGIHLSTFKNAGDPSVRIQLPWLRILGLQFGITLIFLSFMFAVIFSMMILRKHMETFNAEIVTLIRAEFETATLKKLSILILFACGFWIVSLTSYSISIDDEYAAFRQDHRVWVAQGRWMVYLLSKFILPQPVIPFLPNLIFCISVAISYLIILRAHHLKLDWKSTFLFPVFMAFPTWYFIAEFYANILAVSFGLTLSSISLLIFSRAISQQWESVKKKTFIMLVCMQAALLCMAVGTYQSYLLAFISMGLGIITLKLVRETHISSFNTIKQVAYLFLVTFSSFVLYQSISFVFQVGLDVQMAYIDGFVNPAIILKQPWYVISSTVIEAGQIYTGSDAIFGVSLGAVGLLLMIGFVALYNMLPNWRGRVVVFVMLLGCIATPFLLNLLAGGATRIPYRSMVGIPYVVWFFAMLAVYKSVPLIKKLAVIVITILIFQLVNAHSTYNAATQLALEHDKMLAGEIYHRIVEKLPANDLISHYRVDFYGAKSFNSVFSYIPTSTIGHSFFDWDGGNPHRIVTFMRLIGYEDIATIDCDQRNTLIKYYEDMPAWPSKGAVRQVGDVFLVKMGNRPGLTHVACVK